MQTRKYIMRKRHLFLMLLTLLIMNPAWSEIIKSRVIEEGGTGPYSALMLAEASLPTHTVFRPQDVSQFGADNPLPLIVWGNGACFDSPWEHINFLNEIASHGFLVIATGIFPVAEGEPITARSSASNLVDAMDWSMAQHEHQDNPSFHYVAVQRIAASGMSCGGLQALEEI